MPELTDPPAEPPWLTKVGKTRPDVVLMAPYLVYVGLLALNDWVPKAYMPWMIALRGAGGLYVFWLFRRYLPPLGRAHLAIAVVAGIAVAAGWVAGQHLCNRIPLGDDHTLGGRFFLFPGKIDLNPPHPGADISSFSWWCQATLRITVASTAVPVVEELFWRAFLLRAFIDWHRFEKIPLGTFTWMSFLGTSLLSTLQHPDNWAVSIPCWFAFNGLMIWKKSLLCLMITHGITNLVLYLYVIVYRDWMFW